MEQKQRIGLICFLLGLAGGGFGIYSIIYKYEVAQAWQNVNSAYYRQFPGIFQRSVKTLSPWLVLVIVSLIILMIGIYLFVSKKKE